MRRYLASAAAVGTALLLAGPVMAADMPEYPEIPEVDYDIGGSFYLRGSAALNIHWAPEVKHPWDPADIDPIVAGTAEESQRRSRRIEIALLPRLNELPDPASLDKLLEEGAPASEPLRINSRRAANAAPGAEPQAAPSPAP